MSLRMEIEGEEIEALMERAWHLHDKISDTIHSLSKSHFLDSIRKNNTNPISHEHHWPQNQPNNDIKGLGLYAQQQINNGGFTTRECGDLAHRQDEEDQFAETRSLNAIRNALEVLEDQLHCLHILQSQQHAERDAALTRLEESRSILLKMLTEHRGRELKVIQEALAFAADRSEEEDLHLSPHGFQNTTTAQGNSAIYCQKNEKNDEKSDLQDKRLYGLPHFVSFSIRYVKKSDRLHKMAGVVAKTALVAVSMLAVLGLQQTGQRTMKNSGIQERSRVQKKNNDYKEHQKCTSTKDHFPNRTVGDFPCCLQLQNLDVIFGRG